MGIDYVQLNDASAISEPLKFTTYTVNTGRLTLNWTGTGNLEFAPTVPGTRNLVTPSPISPYALDIMPTNRFFGLKRP